MSWLVRSTPEGWARTNDYSNPASSLLIQNAPPAIDDKMEKLEPSFLSSISEQLDGIPFTTLLWPHCLLVTSWFPHLRDRFLLSYWVSTHLTASRKQRLLDSFDPGTASWRYAQKYSCLHGPGWAACGLRRGYNHLCFDYGLRPSAHCPLCRQPSWIYLHGLVVAGTDLLPNCAPNFLSQPLSQLCQYQASSGVSSFRLAQRILWRRSTIFLISW